MCFVDLSCWVPLNFTLTSPHMLNGCSSELELVELMEDVGGVGVQIPLSMFSEFSDMCKKSSWDSFRRTLGRGVNVGDDDEDSSERSLIFSRVFKGNPIPLFIDRDFTILGDRFLFMSWSSTSSKFWIILRTSLDNSLSMLWSSISFRTYLPRMRMFSSRFEIPSWSLWIWFCWELRVFSSWAIFVWANWNLKYFF